MLAAAWLRPAAEKPPLLLFTTLPLYWGEAGDVGAMLAPEREPPWPRRTLEERWTLEPVDTLAGTLKGRTRLLMAQPRPLSPEENVTLDDWVAAGGRLLLFADPALTAGSAYALGDRRRPQEVILLSPILARWGLALSFDEAQERGEIAREIDGGVALPVNLPGRLAQQPGGRPDALCRVEASALIARCRIGKGSATIVADAALFEDQADSATSAAALNSISALTF